MAISDITGAGDFDSEPPAYHWAFIAFLVSFGFLPITWLIPLPGVCLINIIISLSLFYTFFSLYAVEFSENKEQYLVNLGYLIADAFNINLITIYNNAIEMKNEDDLSSSSKSTIQQYLDGDRSLLDATENLYGFDDYATVVVKSASNSNSNSNTTTKSS